MDNRATSFHFVPWSSPPSPLAQKRRRISSNTSMTTPMLPPPLPSPPFRFDNTTDLVVDNSNDVKHTLATAATFSPQVIVGSLTSDASASSAAEMQDALALIESDSQLVRQKKVAQEQDDKQTKPSYARHIKNYEAWWNQSLHWTSRNVPAFPITAAKATLFLDYETMRPQVCKDLYKAIVILIPTASAIRNER